MNKKLIVVESPTKSRTISGFLGSDWEVASSYGHIKDLPKKELGVDPENNFEPKFIIPPKSRQHIKSLKDKLKNVESVWLAMDEDREGEAIAQHIVEALQLEKQGIPFQRLVFHEITGSAVQQALKNPRDIDKNLVDAQKARRVLDRLVGYKLSPLLWKKIAYGLSAGRVQSVALRLVAEREKEIEQFKPQEYWSILGIFSNKKAKQAFEAALYAIEGKKLEKLAIKNQSQAQEIKAQAEKQNYQVKSVQTKAKTRHPFPPFITATLQQEAGLRFGFSAARTMRLAQQLYEGVSLGQGGRTGLITYHRTDSVRLAPKALEQAKNVIGQKFGQKYFKVRQWKVKGRAQEAHEAIRPTELWRSPDQVKKHLNPSQFKLYQLIWQRTLASQMAPAQFDSTVIEIKSSANNQTARPNYIFRASGQTLKFDGFLRIYPAKYKEQKLPPLKQGAPLALLEIKTSQHFTKPPPRYTESMLIKELKDNGVGRPSTYAPIVGVIQQRNYVQKREGGRLYLTPTGEAVNNLLVKHFPKIVDIDFTAHMEDDLDEVAEGQKKWQPVVKEFYLPFEKALLQKEKEISRKDFTEKPTNRQCPKCGQALVKKLGRFGQFYSCSNFPDCKYAEPILDKIGIQCPQCGQGEIVRRRSKKGKTFFGCSNYPNCKNAYWNEPTSEKCPKCGKLLTKKNKSTLICADKECGYQKTTNNE